MNRRKRKEARGFNDLIPHVGLNRIRLGDTDANIRRILKEDGVKFNNSMCPYRWELEEPWCTLSFVKDGDSTRLAQISSMSSAIHVFGEELTNMSLVDALLVLKITSFDDTVWSLKPTILDFKAGKAIIDEPSPQKCTPSDLSAGGTLWIKSLGIGLTLRESKVNLVSIRLDNHVPQVGHGSLDNHTINALCHRRNEVAFLETIRGSGVASILARIPWRSFLVASLLVTGCVMVWVAYTMITDYVTWPKAKEVVGTIVELKYEGSYLRDLIVEYSTSESKTSRVAIPSQYVTVCEIGQDVALVYREFDPLNAKTKQQAHDHFTSLSPNWLIFGIPLFFIELQLLSRSPRKRRLP